MASMSSWDEPAPRRGGLRSVVKTTLWAAGSLGVFAAVLVWSFDLGAKSPATLQAMQFDLDDWRVKPDVSGGRQIPDQERQVYERFDGEVAPEGALVASAEPERPTKDDREVARRAGGQSVDADAFLSLVAQAVDNPDAATRRRVIDLDLQAPRAGGPSIADRPEAPPNVGMGAEPTPARRPSVDGASAESAFVTGDSSAAERRGAPEIATVETTTAADTVIATADATTDVASGALDGPPSVDGDAAIETEVAPGGDAGAQVQTEIASAAPEPQSQPQNPVATEPAETPPPTERQIDPVLLAPQTQSGSQRPAGPKIYQIQLGALDSVADVEASWRKLQAAEPTLLGKYELDVQPVNVDGTRLYRLRAGSFSNREQAADLCTALRGKEIDCFPASK